MAGSPSVDGSGDGAQARAAASADRAKDRAERSERRRERERERGAKSSSGQPSSSSSSGKSRLLDDFDSEKALAGSRGGSGKAAVYKTPFEYGLPSSNKPPPALAATAGFGSRFGARAEVRVSPPLAINTTMSSSNGGGGGGGSALSPTAPTPLAAHDSAPAVEWKRPTPRNAGLSSGAGSFSTSGSFDGGGLGDSSPGGTLGAPSFRDKAEEQEWRRRRLDEIQAARDKAEEEKEDALAAASGHLTDKAAAAKAEKMAKKAFQAERASRKRGTLLGGGGRAVRRAAGPLLALRFSCGLVAGQSPVS